MGISNTNDDASSKRIQEPYWPMQTHIIQWLIVSDGKRLLTTCDATPPIKDLFARTTQPENVVRVKVYEWSKEQRAKWILSMLQEWNREAW